MRHFGLVACAGGKHPHPSPAKDLYDSALFSKGRQFVERNCEEWFILSAKHGLVRPDDEIAPYEETLNNKSRAECREWSERVWASLNARLQPNDTVTILAGERYRQDLVPLLQRHGCAVAVPMEGLGIGRQLQWLNLHLAGAKPTTQRERDQEQCYRLLAELEAGVGGKQPVSTASRSQWPKRGVYLFFENGETRGNGSTQRVVRVGTHAVSQSSRATLWNRLSAHRGTSAGTGNHRGSIFRLHIGHSLIARESLLAPSWGTGQSAKSVTRRAEEDLERLVSNQIAAMQLLWLNIDDEPSRHSDRAYVERSLIGLFSALTGPTDAPSLGWLGHHSQHPGVRTSGLWNVNHTEYQPNSEFLNVLETYVRATIGSGPAPSGSIAPAGWLERDLARSQPGGVLRDGA